LDWNPLQWIIDQIQKTVGNHLPFYDLDHDRFSSEATSSSILHFRNCLTKFHFSN